MLKKKRKKENARTLQAAICQRKQNSWEGVIWSTFFLIFFINFKYQNLQEGKLQKKRKINSFFSVWISIHKPVCGRLSDAIRLWFGLGWSAEPVLHPLATLPSLPLSLLSAQAEGHHSLISNTLNYRGLFRSGFLTGAGLAGAEGFATFRSKSGVKQGCHPLVETPCNKDRDHSGICRPGVAPSNSRLEY